MSENNNERDVTVIDKTDVRLVCLACGCEAEEMGVLNSGCRVYIHGSSFWYTPLRDEHGRLSSAVDQIRAHGEADS